MNAPHGAVTVAGVDGCAGGWIAVMRHPGESPTAKVFSSFADLLDALPDNAMIAVDMPIGLPDRIGRGGRGPESLVRAVLGERRSSVFSIPSRSAVYAECGPFAFEAERRAAHRRASRVAMETSDPPKKISIQAFGLFAKIREIDALLRQRADLRPRIVESHPEAAFWRLNDERPMRLPKKIRGSVNPAGMGERRELLLRFGHDPALFDTVPRGAGADDLLDAAAVLLVAARHAAGRAIPFPDPPPRDEYGIGIAIWT